MNPDNIHESHTAQGALIAAGAIISQIRKNTHPQGRDFVILAGPGGCQKVEYIERPDSPTRRSGTVTVDDVKSLIEMTNRYAGPRTIIYASLAPAGVVVVLNDNPSITGTGSTGVTSFGDWRDHRVGFALKHSKEHETWSSASTFDQQGFAEFIEDNLPDFKAPTGAKMLETALNFKVNRAMSFKSAMNLSDGSMQLEYVDRNADGGTGATRKLAMPEEFTVGIPVWAGVDQKLYDFKARLRYRVDGGGSLSIKIALHRPHKVVEQAFKDTLDTIRRGVKDVPLVFGNP